jgi:hypothetical protein
MLMLVFPNISPPLSSSMVISRPPTGALAQGVPISSQPEHYGQQTSEEHHGDVRVVERPHSPDSHTNVLVHSLLLQERQNNWPLVQCGLAFDPIHGGKAGRSLVASVRGRRTRTDSEKGRVHVIPL